MGEIAPPSKAPIDAPRPAAKAWTPCRRGLTIGQMFTYSLTVQLHHTDAYDIIFFANQFRFCHDVYQAWLASVGIPLAKSRERSQHVAVVVHAESDYQGPIEVGDQLELRMTTGALGTTSFTLVFTIVNQNGAQVGTARIVHVTVDAKTAEKMPIPTALREALEGNR
jgi:1,4-dihydroxy-2-naphthoyl-CoA hydrolase